MGHAIKQSKHVLIISGGQLQEAAHLHPLLNAIPSLAKPNLSNKPIGYIASYRYGQQFAQWSSGDPANFRLLAPCGSMKKPCSECKELLSACADGPPLIFILKNCVEAYIDTSSYSKPDTGQAPSVPLQIISAGNFLGLLETVISVFAGNRSLGELPVKPRRISAAAGARSVHLTIPINDEEVASRVLGLPGGFEAYEQMGAPALDFEHDHWLAMRLLSSIISKSKNGGSEWCAEVLVIPRRVLETALNQEATLHVELLKPALVESASRMMAAQATQKMTGLAYSQVSNADALAHITELLQIINNQRLGFGPAQDDSLGPFSVIQELMCNSPIMKTRTLKNRFPAIIIPKKFSFNSPQPDYFYYSLRRPSAEMRCQLPERPFQIMEKVKKAISKTIPDLYLAFFASDLAPNTRLKSGEIQIRAVESCDGVTRDFSKQLELAKSKFAVNVSTPLARSRSGFLGHFIRISNKADYAAKPRASQNSGAPLSHQSLKTA